MTKPRNARQTSSGRLYQWPPPPATPENFWSVTTILKGGIPAPALIAWGMKAVAEFAVKNYPTLAAMLSAPEDPKSAAEGAVQWLKGAPYRERERKGELGTTIHEYTEAYMLGKPMPPAPLEAAPYLKAFGKFLAEWKPTFKIAEASVYNRRARYAGTLDAIVEIPQLPGLTLLDYKTGKGVYPEVAQQLAAYRFAEFIGMRDGTEAPMPEIASTLVLHLKPDADYDLYPVVSDANVFKAFRHTIEQFRWMEETSKAVIGEPL